MNDLHNKLSPKLILSTMFLMLLYLTSLIWPSDMAAMADNLDQEGITRENIASLKPLAQIDFSALDGQFDSGWFTMDDAAAYILVRDREQRLWLLATETGELLGTFVLNTSTDDIVGLIDADFETIVDSAGDRTAFAALYMEGLRLHMLVVPDISSAEPSQISWETDRRPQAMWLDANRWWIEFLPGQQDDGPLVMQGAELTAADFQPDEAMLIPYGPASDEEAVVRMGRINPPVVVTSSQEGLVKVWDIQRDQLLTEADNGTGEAAVFGHINARLSHLAWRDPFNESLFLLDLVAAENRFVADLNGAYAQWLFLTQAADLILAVNLDFVPNIFAWDTATGEMLDLGPYRSCGRPQPDMARMSDDGTSLIISCDTGLELWRIAAG